MFNEKLPLGVAVAEGGAVDAACSKYSSQEFLFSWFPILLASLELTVGPPEVASVIVVAALPTAMPSSSAARAASYWMASSRVDWRTCHTWCCPVCEL